jgi:branched-chain amino acid transport system ATP-binding protein
MTNGDVILAAKDLCIEFNGFKAVNRASFNVRRGHIHALIGPNGAGKTTCFNLLTRFLTPTSGSIHFNGQDITRLVPDEIARRGMVRSFQISAVFGDMTVLENVRVALQRRKHGASFDFWRSERTLSALDGEAESLVESVGLSRYINSRAAELSYGRKRALEVATTLALDPEMLLLDEPMAGMGHEDVERTASLIREIAKTRTVLMVEHNLKVVAQLSDRITVLARGQVLAEGDYATVSADPKVIEAYIGASHD